MKYKLETNDIPEYQIAIDGWKWRCVAKDMDDWLRSLNKYQGIEDIPIFKVRDKLSELCNDYNVTIHE